MATSIKKTAEKKQVKQIAPKSDSKPKVLNPRIDSVKYDIHAGLKENFGFTEFKGTQEKAIKSLLSGKDTFVIMPTGGGQKLMLPASCYYFTWLCHYCISPNRFNEKPGGPG